MKRLFLIVILLVVMLCQSAFGISVSRGLIPSGLIGPNEHVHVTTRPGAKIYAVIVTPTGTTFGFANIISTQYEVNALSGSGRAGNDWISNSAGNKVLVDIQGAVASVSIPANFGPNGIAVGGNLFVDVYDAQVEVWYEQ
ncbi:hypothetical protein LCGC14_1312870 [marine sediment metagenome]|uniref:Uncharacterized protein n=1 Tax=marine sediment metagenome TaxID=412755 RepID=A0A0F9NP69_9ZZZZ